MTIDQLDDEEWWHLWKLRVQREVPTGFNSHKERQDHAILTKELDAGHLQPLMEKKAAYQLGTLGGGNHFMEAQHDQEGRIWLMVHSGSRHLGLRIAEYYHKLAIEQSRERGLDVGDDLAELELGTSEAAGYLHDMGWATYFARISRRQMMRHMVDQIGVPFEFDRAIDTPHNYAIAHLGDNNQDVIITHRKGATSARDGEHSIIPGSMGSKSYIVEGLGNPDGLESCSHGAGRARGRNATRKMYSVEEFQEALAGTFSTATKGTLDEAPMAYKDIETVMARQHDLVRITHELTPIITIKGDSKARDD